MMRPPLAPDEPFRLDALRRLGLLDTPLDERFERITRIAQRVLDVPIAAVSLVDADRQWFKSIQGLDVAQTSRDVSICGHTILQETVLIVPDARKDPRFASNPLVTGEPHLVFYAGCPLHGPDGAMVGSLCVIDRQPRDPTEDDIQTLRDLAALVEAQLSNMITNSVQQDLISQIVAEQRQALVDPLTRLWNRAGIFHLLGGDSSCSDDGFAMMMADVDRFKQINDTWGHLVGDEALRQISRRMLGAIREVDAIGRYGGEEFLVVCGALSTSDEALALAERLRSRIGETPVECDGKRVEVTMSVGVAWRPPGATVDTNDLLRIADTALYSAKRSGRNSVVIEDAEQSRRSDSAAA